jgi:hypothetical protein
MNSRMLSKMLWLQQSIPQEEGSEGQVDDYGCCKGSLDPTTQKKTTKEMFYALIALYQSENIDINMILWNKLRSIKMIRSDMSYQLPDERHAYS